MPVLIDRMDDEPPKKLRRYYTRLREGRGQLKVGGFTLSIGQVNGKWVRVDVVTEENIDITKAHCLIKEQSEIVHK